MSPSPPGHAPSPPNAPPTFTRAASSKTGIPFVRARHYLLQHMHVLPCHGTHVRLCLSAEPTASRLHWHRSVPPAHMHLSPSPPRCRYAAVHSVAAGTPCQRAGNWCYGPGKVYTNTDCDGDGVLDHACDDTDGNRGTILSSTGCSTAWPAAAVSSCPNVFGERPPKVITR